MYVVFDLQQLLSILTPVSDLSLAAQVHDGHEWEPLFDVRNPLFSQSAGRMGLSLSLRITFRKPVISLWRCAS